VEAHLAARPTCSVRRSRTASAASAVWTFLHEPELQLGPHVLVPDVAAWRIEPSDAATLATTSFFAQ